MIDQFHRENKINSRKSSICGTSVSQYTGSWKSHFYRLARVVPQAFLIKSSKVSILILLLISLPSPSAFVQKSLLLASCIICISQSGRDLIFIPYRPCSCILASISYHLILSSKRIEMLQNGTMEDLFQERDLFCVHFRLQKDKISIYFPIISQIVLFTGW